MSEKTLVHFFDEEYTEEASLSVAVISLVICVVGIVGNAVAIFVIISLKEYQKSITHWYILNLALADSLFLLTLPFQVSTELNRSWIYANGLCKAKEVILFCNYYASILFLMEMSLDRYLAVCKTFSLISQWLRRRDSAYIIAPAIWIVAILLSVPVMVFTSIVGDSPESCRCVFEFPKPIQNNCAEETERTDICMILLQKRQENQYCVQSRNTTLDIQHVLGLLRNASAGSGSGSGTSVEEETSTSFSGSALNESMSISNETAQNHLNSLCHYEDQASGFLAFIWFNFIVMFVIPLVVMVACYGMIILRLSTTRVRSVTPKSSFTPSVSSSVMKQNEKKRRSSRSQVDRRRVNIMCASLVSCFVICWLPYHSVHLAKFAGIRNTSTADCALLFKFASVLAFLNSALNPYLYNFLGTNFSRRWKTASQSFRQSVGRRRSASTGSFASLGRTAHNRIVGKRTSNTGTVITKMSRNPETKHSATDIGTYVNVVRPAPESSNEIAN